MEIITKCKECQFFQKQTTKHANPLRPIDLSWPFAVWGIDIVGVLPRALGGFRFLFVGIDTFTKWMEATPVVNITQEAAVKLLQSIIYRFSVPQRVLTDNRTQFKGAKFLRCCVDFGIHHLPSSAAHPQINEQVERTNGLLLQGMKTRMFLDLEVKGKNWHKELPQSYGPSEPMSVGPLELRPLVWSMERKSYCHQKSILNQIGWRILIQKIGPQLESWTQIC
jgi:transposase InsO family protein